MHSFCYRYSELASFGQHCLKSIQDTVKDDYLVDNLMMDGLQNQNDNDNPSTNENHFYDIQPICLVRDIRKEENTKVYTELKPLPLIDGTKDGSQNDTSSFKFHCSIQLNVVLNFSRGVAAVFTVISRESG
uniref:Uncharacterized protein LOC114328144 n=1 Tax=Diabrotica virgifera virgifera TaxID=50390 RepID=A0A6P7FI06_DIAVI